MCVHTHYVIVCFLLEVTVQGFHVHMSIHPCVASLLLQERAIKEAIKLIREQQAGTNVDQVQPSTSASADSEQDKQTASADP